MWNGNTYTTSGTYNTTLTNGAGCDSIAKLTLTVSGYPTGNITQSGSDLQIMVSTGTFPYTYEWNTGAT